MKETLYKKNKGIFFISGLFLLFQIFSFLFLEEIKIFDYQKLSGTFVKKDLAFFVVDKKEKQTLYQNKVLYLKNQKKKYEIEKDQGILLKRRNKEYFGILLRFSTVTSYKENDNVEIVLKKKKISILSFIKKTWEGDKDKTD